jgi:hypothetical protein
MNKICDDLYYPQLVVFYRKHRSAWTVNKTSESKTTIILLIGIFFLATSACVELAAFAMIARPNYEKDLIANPTDLRRTRNVVVDWVISGVPWGGEVHINFVGEALWITKRVWRGSLKNLCKGARKSIWVYNFRKSCQKTARKGFSRESLGWTMISERHGHIVKWSSTSWTAVSSPRWLHKARRVWNLGWSKGEMKVSSTVQAFDALGGAARRKWLHHHVPQVWPSPKKKTWIEVTLQSKCSGITIFDFDAVKLWLAVIPYSISFVGSYLVPYKVYHLVHVELYPCGTYVHIST